ncbi:MAG: TonB-dependent receptor [Bacteroidales bacterium]|nr:TonB-dependent receptor [Bacteroidales bacterium]
MKKFLLLICLLLPISETVWAQSFSLSGRVVDAEGSAVELAVVSLNKSIWATTDKDGNYTVSNLKKGKYEYQVSFVGYKDLSGTVEISNNTILNFTLQTLSLELNSVTVTAEREDMGSKSVINEEAVRHLQPKSVSDLLQLVPGNLAKNPNLNELSQATVREISSNANNSLGTSVIIDGTPVSNDANLQAIAATRFGTASSVQTDGMSEQTTAGGGTDLRTVSAGVVESMEVISGIPSAEYGNLTSGVVIVKTKAGRTPWEFKAQTDPNSKLAYIGKGFSLRSGGSINIGGDWSQSFSDPRRRYLGYDRLTAAGGYSKVWNKATLNIKGSVYSNVNNRKQDPQLEVQDIVFTNKNVGGRLSVNGSFSPKAALLTSLDYNFSAQVARTEDIHNSKVWSPDAAVTDARESGLHVAVQKTSPYYSEYRLHGVPINLFGQLAGSRYFQIGEKDYNRIKAGIEYTMDANRGRGFTYDLDNPPQGSSAHTLRPRAYKDIPALNNASVFVSDKGRLSFGDIVLKSEIGLRASRLFLDSAKSGGNDGYFVLEPRVNLSLSLLNSDNNGIFDDFSLNGGFGISNKMPTLLYLYPEPTYFDFISLNRYTEAPENRIAVMSTDVVKDTYNPDLKPAHAVKHEIGISWKVGKTSGFVTYFNENHTHEFGFDSQLYWGRYPRFTVPDGSVAPALEGNDVVYSLGGARQTAARTELVEYVSWGRPSNNTHSEKHGIEYGIDLGSIRPLRTTVNINGAWFHIRRTRETTSTSYINKNYAYAPTMPAGSGSVQDRVNTSFRFITHIPELKLVFTTTLQVVWFESRRSVYIDGDGNQRTHDFSYQGKDYLGVDPLGYYDLDGNYTAWNAASMNSDPALNLMVSRFYTYSFLADRISPWALLNIRLTKEFGKGAQLSFTANNVTNTSKYHINKHSYSKTQLYPNMYFGAELKINL